MKKISILWGIVAVGIFSLLTVFGFLYKGKVKEYEALEKKLVEVEKKYADKKFLYPESGDTVKTTLKELKENGLITDFKVKDQECDGYVILSHESTVYEYKGYVKCGDYKTKGYQE